AVHPGLAFAEGELVKKRVGPSLAEVERGPPTLCAEVVIVGWSQGVAIGRADAASVVDRLAVGIRAQQSKSLIEPVLKADMERVVIGVNRRGHGLDVAVQIRERTPRVRRPRARRRAVIDLQAPQMGANAPEIADLERGASRQLALDAKRPLAHIRTRLAELIREDEGRRTHLREWPRPGEVRRQRIGDLILADGKRDIPRDVEHSVTDVPDVIDAGAGANDRLVVELPGDSQPRREIVPVALVGAPAETSVANE